MKHKAPSLFTFGYEGLSIDEFIVRLRGAGIRTVIDVRELPLSRKKGFSKRAFAEALDRAGVAYAHMPALGCPKAVRNAYRDDGDWLGYSRKFALHLRGQADAVAEVARIAGATSTVLVCFEADFNRCHRSLVARAVAAAGGPPVVHLTARSAVAELPAKAAA